MKPLDRVVVVGLDEPVLFAMRGAEQTNSRGRSEATVFLFTPSGVRSRTAVLGYTGWLWLVRYDGEPTKWAAPVPYDGETPEQARAWHEREHKWVLIEHEVRP